MRGTLIFDGRCGFCTRARDVLARLDRHGRVRTVPFQRPGTAERTGLSPDELNRSVWWLGEDGTRSGGAAAVNAALSAALGTGLPLRLYRLPWVRPAQEAAYRWVAAHRSRFPGTTPWCERHADC
jgi:predicted DCC family thiol-disulfide oxidoreductase YuxK